MIRGLEQFMSLSAISRETGIPRSTLRRYKAGGKPSAEVGELYSGILESGFQVIHKEVVREKAARRKVGQVGKGKRVQRVSPQDRTKKIASDSMDFNVMNSSVRAIVAKLGRAAARARLLGIPGIARFLILGAEGSPEYPGEYFWAEPEALSDLTLEEIADVVSETFGRGTPIVMRIQDK